MSESGGSVASGARDDDDEDDVDEEEEVIAADDNDDNDDDDELLLEEALDDPYSTAVSVDFWDFRNAGRNAQALRFRALLAALERHGQVERLTLRFGPFGGGNGDAASSSSSSPRPKDLDRLFGSVLPAHPSLRTISFERCALDPRYLRLLLRVRSSRLDLQLSITPLDGAGAIDALADALRRGLLGSLGVVGCSLDAERGARLVREAIGAASGPGGGHPHLHTLHLSDSDSCRLTEGGISAVLRRLRTNEGLANLDIDAPQQDGEGGTSNGNGGGGGDESSSPAHLHREVNELLSTYNFTLRRLHFVPRGIFGLRGVGGQCQARVDALLRRNDRARLIDGHLRRLNYRFLAGGGREKLLLWPALLGQVSRFPTLVQRLLRRGDVDGLSDQVRSAPANKRRRLLAPPTATSS